MHQSKIELYKIRRKYSDGFLLKISQLELLGFMMLPWNVNKAQWIEADLKKKTDNICEMGNVQNIHCLMEKNEAGRSFKNFNLIKYECSLYFDEFL